ncbi:MAG: hypothetical protein EAZ77_13680 [Nostocales cyanobacterium]|nr:MAG: hypothetical protein EAZ77_13680 [Nostocales cyanobacterium]
MNSVKPSSKIHDDPINYRHTDPPFLWIVVFIGSISLHLLVFWYLRSSDQFRPWIPQSSQDQIAIDLIDISPQPELNTQPKSTATTVKPKLSPSTQNSVTASLPQTTPTIPEKPDDEAINSNFNISRQRESQNTEVNNQPIDSQPTPAFTPQVKFTPKPKPTFTPQVKLTPHPTPTQTVPLDDLPWNRRQEVKLGKGTLLPNDIPSDSPTPISETSPTPISETSPVSTGGGVMANVEPILKDEVEQLRQEQKLRVDALPDVLAEYQGSRTKELELNFLPSDSGLEPANILASLVIDKNGNFLQAIVISIEPATLGREKSIYEQALNEIFEQDSFVGAYNQDGSKPDLSNLYVRIRIEPINSQ